MDEKLHETIKEMDNWLFEIDMDTTSFESQKLKRKLENTLKWIAKNLDKDTVVNYIREHDFDFEYGDVIINLLTDESFNPVIH